MISTPVQPPPGSEEAGAPTAVDDDERSALAAPGVLDMPPLVEDGVIFEAQRRARRRRTAYLIAASALAISAGAFAMFAGSSMVPDQGSEHGESSGFSAPVDEAEIVAGWSRIHVGWVYVYDDGRVVWYPDSHASLREGTEPLHGILVQRLTPNGLGLVRDGIIEPRMLLVDRDDVPMDVWSDPTPEEYLPSQYALCPTDPGGVGAIGDVGAIRDRLSLDLQTLLRGTERTFTLSAGAAEAGAAGAGWVYATGPGPGVDCFVLSPEQARAVWAQGHPRDQAMMLLDDTSYATLTASDGADLEVVFGPVLPDGGWVQSAG